ncbi:MAG: CPBP family intramembrane metalloprotease [Gammaproteobacteria bacterium]|nr:CPBP family intramembrane metalloprotease [Gammaproteobacteria bacterium]NNL51547.1 CPBP family intramembrane metalloprotease [Woeseiaceae bacterium]
MTDAIRWITVLRRLGLFVLAFAGTSAVTITPLATFLSDWADAYPIRGRLYADVAGALAVVSATWVMTKFVDKRAFLTIGFATKGIIRDLSIGLALGTAWLGISVVVMMGFGWASLLSPPGLSGTLVAIAAVSVLFNVATQQLLVCGYILQTLRSKAGLPVAIFLSALLFSALHAAAFQGAWLPPINVFAAGLVFCLAYAITGNLWLPVAIHFAWNLLLGPVLGLTISGTGELGLGWEAFEITGPELYTGGVFGIEGGLIVTLTTAGLVMIFLLIRARQDVSVREGAFRSP